MADGEHPEILPCPHCGGRAVPAIGYPRHKEGREFVQETWNWVRCTVCGCQSGVGPGLDKAIEKWNRRVIPSAQQGETTCTNP